MIFVKMTHNRPSQTAEDKSMKLGQELLYVIKTYVTHPTLGDPIPGTNRLRVKIHTNTIERQWLELKKHCRTCRSEDRIKWYMGEYMYRHNILKGLPSHPARFRKLLKDISRVYPGSGRQGIRIEHCRCRPNCPRQ